MSARLRWEGLDELKDQLRRLPDNLKGEGAAIVEAHVVMAQQDIIAGYPQGPTGYLRGRVRITLRAVSRFGAGALLKSMAPHAWIYEYGTVARKAGPPKDAKTITRGKWPANRGRMHGRTTGLPPQERRAVPKIVRWRARMYAQLVAMLERHGATVSGSIGRRAA